MSRTIFRAQLVTEDTGCTCPLVLTLLQHLALTERPGDDDGVEEPSTKHATELANAAESKTDTSDKSIASEILSPDLILAIEEPELYLHPARCRYLAELLLRLSKPPIDGSEPRNQIIYATHSPYFVDLHRFDQVRIARKPRFDALPAPCCVISQYSLAEAASALARIAGGDPAAFTRDSFRARALPIMTTAVTKVSLQLRLSL